MYDMRGAAGIFNIRHYARLGGELAQQVGGTCDETITVSRIGHIEVFEVVPAFV